MSNLNKEQLDEVLAWSEFMVKGSDSILKAYNVIAAIDPAFAVQALSKIIQKLQKPLDKKAHLEDLNEMWNMGQLDKSYYEKRLAEIEKQFEIKA